MILILISVLILVFRYSSQWSDPLIGFFFLFISPIGLLVYIIIKLVFRAKGKSSFISNKESLHLGVNQTVSKLGSKEISDRETEMLGEVEKQ